MKQLIIAIGLMFCLQTLAAAPRQQSWDQWLQGVKAEAIAKGISHDTVKRAFYNMKPSRAHLQLDRRQPEKRLTFLKYRNTRGSSYRIRMGIGKYKKNKALLDEVGEKYGVSPCFIAAIWGLETSYGHFMGHYKVIRSLATLAYDGRRSAFFRKQLFLALKILDEGHVSLKNFKGEWAGATGQPQFLPSSFYNYAVDYNGDGHKDIWKTKGDVFASIANYLAKNGWERGQPWAVKVSVPRSFDRTLFKLKITHPVSYWTQHGIHILGKEHINPNAEASIIDPDGGPNFMVFKNFKVIMTWNHSIYYAGTVGYMAEQICKRIGRSLTE